MHDYLLSTEVVRFAFMLGVAVSMLLYERRHLTTGSIVVPGYIATFILYPMIVAATFVNALASYVLVNKVLRRWFLLYGRTKFTVLALISILIQTAMLKLTPSGAWLWESDFKLFVGVGYVVPALIAHDMGRQGVTRTIKSVMYAATLVAIPIALALAFDVPGVNDLAPLEGFGDMAIDTAWLPFSVLLSAAAAWGVATNYGMRCGGFVGAAFIGMFMGDPWQVLVAGAIAAATYLIVTRLLMNHMILFGRRKFSSMLLVASSLSWLLLWSGREFFGPEVQRHLDLGSLALAPLFLPGLIANDAQRTSPRKVVLGFAMASTFVLTWTWWAQSLFEGLALALAWKVVAVGALGAIFWRQVIPVRRTETTDACRDRGRGGPGALRTTVGRRGRDGVRDGWLPTLGRCPSGRCPRRRALAHGDGRRWHRGAPDARRSGRGEHRPRLVTRPRARARRRSSSCRTSALAARSRDPRRAHPVEPRDLPVRTRTAPGTPFPPPAASTIRASSEQDPHRSSEQNPFGVDEILPG